MIQSPWVERFNGLDDQAISLRVRHVPNPVSDLCRSPSAEASNLLWHTLREIFLPTPRTLQVINKILAIAISHSKVTYPDVDTFWQKLHRLDFQPEPATCFAGLAGVGKSEVLKAINRLMQEVLAVDAGEGCRLMMRAFFYSRVEEGDSEASILRSFLQSSWEAQQNFLGVSEGVKRNATDGKENDSPWNVKAVKKASDLAKRFALRDGVATILLDELQFMTQSSEANTKVTKALLASTYLGPPLVYATNYDMGHRLKNRGQQDRERLLARHIVLLPDSLGRDEDVLAWQDYLTECVRVSAGCISIDPLRDGEALHQYTFGLKRKLLELFRIGYGHARDKSRPHATIEDFEWAYRSSEYSVHREDVEELIAITLGRKSARLDLQCPFPLDPEEWQHRAAYQKAKNIEMVTNLATASSLSPDEKKAYVAAGGTVPTKPQKKSSKTSTSRQTKPPMAESMRGGAQRYKNQQQSQK